MLGGNRALQLRCFGLLFHFAVDTRSAYGIFRMRMTIGMTGHRLRSGTGLDFALAPAIDFALAPRAL